MSIGLPESSVRGLCTAWASFAEERSEAVARALWESSVGWQRTVLRDLKVYEDPPRPLKAEGARKSRYSGRDIAAVMMRGAVEKWWRAVY